MERGGSAQGRKERGGGARGKEINTSRQEICDRTFSGKLIHSTVQIKRVILDLSDHRIKHVCSQMDVFQ
jgi:hypothetical protein